MDRSEAKKFLPIFEAYTAGSEIEFKTRDGDWVRIDNVTICYGDQADRYRIKPEPKLRPWRPEEVPLGALIRRSEAPSGTGVITFIEDCGRIFFGQRCEIGIEEAFLIYKHSTDGGKTWLPCGVMEAQP